MERDDSPDGQPDMGKEGRKPGVKSMKADKSAFDVDKWRKCSVDGFDHLDKWSTAHIYKNGR